MTSLSQDNKNGLTHSGSRALTLVQERTGITLSQVSEALSWSTSKTAYILNLLEQKRLIRSEYKTKRTNNGQESVRHLFPVGGQKLKRKRSPRQSAATQSSRIEGILTYIRKTGYDAKVERQTKGGEYLIRLRPRGRRGSRVSSSKNLTRAPKTPQQSGYQEGSRVVRPRRRRNKS